MIAEGQMLGGGKDFPASIGATTPMTVILNLPTTPQSTVSVTNPGAQTGAVGTAVRLPIQASDSDGGALSYSASGLPPGLSIDTATGVIAGTPTTTGASSVTVTATDVNGGSASTTFQWTIVARTPGISLQPSSGPPGSSVAISGTGFFPGSTVDVYFGAASSPTASFTADPSGNITGMLAIPSSLPKGPQSVQANDGHGDISNTTFTVTAGLTLKPSSGPPGSGVAVTGTGFVPGSTVDVYFGGATSPIASFTAGPSGGFTGTFLIPTSAGTGPQSVLANDGSHGDSANTTFTVT
jgi:hypothetical protein